MDLFEFQGKLHLARYGVPVPEGGIASTPAEAEATADIIGYPVVIKAQVRVGGRGKAGGIKVAADADEVMRYAAAILGMEIGGQTADQVLVEPAADIASEHYASFTVDRAGKAHLVIASASGGVDIEEVARPDPDAVIRMQLDPLGGFSSDQARRVVADAGLDAGASVLLERMYAAYVEGDAELVEVNPLAVLADGRVVALDAKVSLDDNAAFRHPEWDEWRASETGDDRERLAREKGLNYVGLSGSVGIIGNGAGLVMATLDVVSQAGGSAANFLDIGGGASADVVTAALEVVNSDPEVKAIFVNIFGGITRGEEVAAGIIEALNRVDLRSPIVVRLDGTNAEEGRALLAAHASESLISEPTMTAAARRAVELAGQPPKGATR
ncbi:MAG TPA: ADP-forming succinate--CoA ligase subunit beta [Acidimicrobiales bacterium]|nr:ADP-forming succinate--CoA ligase subunit beta [Acidimicrobiales bacterium]